MEVGPTWERKKSGSGCVGPRPRLQAPAVNTRILLGNPLPDFFLSHPIAGRRIPDRDRQGESGSGFPRRIIGPICILQNSSYNIMTLSVKREACLGLSIFSADMIRVFTGTAPWYNAGPLRMRPIFGGRAVDVMEECSNPHGQGVGAWSHSRIVMRSERRVSRSRARRGRGAGGLTARSGSSWPVC